MGSRSIARTTAPDWVSAGGVGRGGNAGLILRGISLCNRQPGIGANLHAVTVNWTDARKGKLERPLELLFGCDGMRRFEPD